ATSVHDCRADIELVPDSPFEVASPAQRNRERPARDQLSRPKRRGCPWLDREAAFPGDSEVGRPAREYLRRRKFSCSGSLAFLKRRPDPLHHFLKTRVVVKIGPVRI